LVSKTALQQKYGLGGKSAIANWMRIFGYEDPRPGFNGIIPKDRSQIFSMAPSKQTDIQALEAKIKALEKQLAEAELKAIVYPRVETVETTVPAAGAAVQPEMIKEKKEEPAAEKAGKKK
jgi:hypothetical protein